MRVYNNIERPDFTPNFIKSLKPDEIFVFGSNLAGAHRYSEYRAPGIICKS